MSCKSYIYSIFAFAQALHGLAPKCKLGGLIDMHELVKMCKNNCGTLLSLENGKNLIMKGWICKK